jgi:hypothetical protein
LRRLVARNRQLVTGEADGRLLICVICSVSTDLKGTAGWDLLQ